MAETTNALHVKLTEANRNKIFFYLCPDEARPEVFSIGLKTDASLESLLVHHRRQGICIHSTWLDQNKRNATITTIMPFNRASRLIPGAVFIGTQVEGSTTEQMIRSLSSNIEDLARALCVDTGRMGHSQSQEQHALLLEAKLVVEQGFKPTIIHLDMCLTQLQAVRNVWPDAQFRISQLYLLQAIKGRAIDDGVAFPDGLGLTAGQGKALSSAIANFQRLRNYSEVIDFQHEFFDALLQLCVESSTRREVPQVVKPVETFSRLKVYFMTQWMSPQWLPYWTKLGLPWEKNQVCSQTNVFEGNVFTSLDGLLLEYGKHKRLDLLVLQIVDMFDYYQVIRPEGTDNDVFTARDEERIDLALAAHSIWQQGLVLDQRNGNYLVRIRMKDSDGQKEIFKEYHIQLDQPWCTCTMHQHTGISCSHMDAAKLHRLNGPPKASLDKAGRNEQTSLG